MFAQFNRLKKPINIKGKASEKAVFSRVGRSSSSNFKSNFVYTCLLQENTKLENGDIFTAKVGLHQREEQFLVISVRKSDESIQATVYKCNGTAFIYRSMAKYDEYDNMVGSEVSLIAEVPTNHVTVNATMRLLDAGLLPSTTKEFRLPPCDIRELDRIVLDGKNFCVDAIDTTKFDGLLAVQTSNDNRSWN
jgi:hypothetical protein